MRFSLFKSHVSEPKHLCLIIEVLIMKKLSFTYIQQSTDRQKIQVMLTRLHHLNHYPIVDIFMIRLQAFYKATG